jgi:hypothetical protein
MIQSGEGDWIINSHRSGTDRGDGSWHQGRKKRVFWQERGFLFGGLSPAFAEAASPDLFFRASRIFCFTSAMV